MEVGTKFEVIKGGKIDPFRDGGVVVKYGEIWHLGDANNLVKLNKRGGCTSLLNGRTFAACGLRGNRLRKLEPSDAAFIAHDELIKRVSR